MSNPRDLDDLIATLATVVGLPEFARQAAKHLTADEREDAILRIALERDDWPIIKDSGGIRKDRFGRADRGKSGGVRVIYFFHCDGCPTYLITLYPKNVKDNLSAAELAAMRAFVRIIKDAAHGDAT